MTLREFQRQLAALKAHPLTEVECDSIVVTPHGIKLIGLYPGNSEAIATLAQVRQIGKRVIEAAPKRPSKRLATELLVFSKVLLR